MERPGASVTGPIRIRRRPRPRDLLWLIWPSLPASWSEVPGRLRPALTQVTRLTVAATIAYVIADVVTPGILDLTAPLTALLVVQASTVGTLLMGLVRVGAVLTGVLVAVLVTTGLGLTWWSLALVIAVSLLLAMTLRLGDQTLEAPISGMLILAVAVPGTAAETRVLNTLIGTIVGIAFSLLLPIGIPNRQASEAVRRLARTNAALLDEIAVTLGERAPDREEVAAWLAWADHAATESREAGAAVDAVRERRRLNPRALSSAVVHPGLQSALDRLNGCLQASRALVVAIGRETRAPENAAGGADAAGGPVAAGGADPLGAELRGAFAVVLDDLADGLRAFGDLIEAEFGRRSPERADQALERTLEIVRECRAVLTELLLLDVDPRARADLWMLQGSVLTAVDHAIAQLDLEGAERSREAWLDRVSRRVRTSRGSRSAPG